MEGMVTLKAACKEALRRGFTFVWIPEVSFLDNLAEFTDGIEEDDSKEYSIFGTMILRVTDAWKEDAETYELY